MVAYTIMRPLLFVFFQITTNVPTTRDIVGEMGPQALERAKVFGIFMNMIMIISIFILLPVMWFTWGVLISRGRVMNDIEKYFASDDSDVQPKEVKQYEESNMEASDRPSEGNAQESATADGRDGESLSRL